MENAATPTGKDAAIFMPPQISPVDRSCSPASRRIAGFKFHSVKSTKSAFIEENRAGDASLLGLSAPEKGGERAAFNVLGLEKVTTASNHLPARSRLKLPIRSVIPARPKIKGASGQLNQGSREGTSQQEGTHEQNSDTPALEAGRQVGTKRRRYQGSKATKSPEYPQEEAPTPFDRGQPYSGLLGRQLPAQPEGPVSPAELSLRFAQAILDAANEIWGEIL